MSEVEIKLFETESGKEIADPVYYMGNWYFDWRAHDDGCEMDEGFYIIHLIIKKGRN